MTTDKELMENFLKAMCNRISKETQNEINNTNIEFSAMGVVSDTETTVTKDNSGNDIQINKYMVDIGFVVTDPLKNLSGETISKGDTVKIFYDKRDMRNAYIGVKF